MNRLRCLANWNSKVAIFSSLFVLWCSLTTTLLARFYFHNRNSVAIGPLLSAVATRPLLLSESQAFNIEGLKVELYIHPECACTRTTLLALEALQYEFPELPLPTIYVAAYPGQLSNMKASSNYRAALNVRTAAICEDWNATRAKFYGAIASGTICISDSGGIVYCGGITDGRENPPIGSNHSSIREFLKNGESKTGHSQVYGCRL